MAKIQDLAKYLSKKHKIQQKEAERFLTALVDVLNEGLHYEKLVKVKGLGTFKVIEVKNRESVDVNTGERILIEGRPKITFTPDAVMKDLVNKPFAQFETVVLNEGVTFDNLSEEPEVELTEEPEPQPEIEQLMEEKPAPEPEVEEEQPQIVEEQPEEIIVPEETVTETVVPLAEMPVSEVEEPEMPEETPAEETALPEVEEPDKPEDSEYSEDSENSEYSENSENSDNSDNPEPSEPSDYSDNFEPKSSKSWIDWLLGMIAVGALMYFVGYHFGKQSAQAVQEPQVVAADTTSVEKTQAPVDTVANKVEDEKAAAQAAAARAKADSIAQAEAYAKAEAAKKAAYEAEVKKQQEEATTQSSATDSKALTNARNIVRTGAYNIVGTQQSVVVRKGQTLERISKTYLGPGMEVYVMVHNGVTEAKEGSTLKIPKLQVKKKH